MRRFGRPPIVWEPVGNPQRGRCAVDRATMANHQLLAGGQEPHRRRAAAVVPRTVQ